MKRLTRSSTNKMISGVCGGIAEYFNMDATLIRILYVLLALNSSTSFIVIYIICTIIIPEDEGVIYHDDSSSTFKDNSPLFLGIGLIVLGLMFLTRTLLSSYNLRLFHQINRMFRQVTNFWPVLLIVLGILIITNQKNNK